MIMQTRSNTELDDVIDAAFDLTFDLTPEVTVEYWEDDEEITLPWHGARGPSVDAVGADSSRDTIPCPPPRPETVRVDPSIFESRVPQIRNAPGKFSV